MEFLELNQICEWARENALEVADPFQVHFPELPSKHHAFYSKGSRSGDEAAYARDLVLRLAQVTRPVRIPGVSVEVRLRQEGNASADQNPERFACLERLAARHGLGKLPPMTFWEVARIVSEHA